MVNDVTTLDTKHTRRDNSSPRADRGGATRPCYATTLLRAALAAAAVVLATYAPASALNSGDVTINGITPFAAVDSNNCAGGAGPHAMFMQVTVTNTTAGTLTNLSATLNGFPASAASPPSPPTAFTLDLGESTSRYIGSLAAGGKANLYWFINYPCTLPPTSGSSINYTVTVSDSTPNSVTSSSQTVTTRSELSASAGGDVLSAAIGAGAVVGQILKVTTTYAFGNPASGSDMMMQPAGNVSFDSSRFRLIALDITSTTFTSGALVTADNQLYFTTVAGPSQNSMVVDYFFLALATSASSTLTPFADLKSGSQEKYTGNYGTCTNTPCDQTLPAPNDPFTISKSASPTSLPSGGTATYTITVTNTSSFDTSFDTITDVLPSGATYQGFGAGSGITAANSSSVPSVGASGTIIWRAAAGTPPPASNRNWFVAANSSITLVYTVSIPATPGNYDNSVTGAAGGFTFGPATSRIIVGPTPTNTAAPTATNTAVPTATNTAVPTATNTAIPTATNTAIPTATNTAIPTATNTAIPTATNTAIPTGTNTAIPTATNTAIPTATDTAVPTATETAVPAATDTAVPTATETAVPTATDTAVPTATDTAVATATETADPTATETTVPTATHTAVPTATDTSVPTATNTSIPTATNTPIPTATNTSVPTATNSSVPTATNTSIPTATNTSVPTATNTSVPTATTTSVPTATNTSVPTATNSSVPTATNSSVPTATNTPVPTATNTSVPTATNTSVPTATPVPPTLTPTGTPTPSIPATPTSPPPPPGCGNGSLDMGEECDDGLLNSDTVADACRTNCRLPHCGDGIADTPIVDFVFVIENSVSMKADLNQIEQTVGQFPERILDAGVDARFAIIRFGTGSNHPGSDLPDLWLDFTTDGTAFRAAAGGLRNFVSGPTESGTEAFDFAFDQLSFRPNARPIFMLMTDEDDDLPVSIEPGALREPPRLWLLRDARRAQFQARLDQTAQRLISAHAQAIFLVNPGDRPTKRQYGSPSATKLANGVFQLDATLARLRVGHRETNLQGQLLASGQCVAGRCARGHSPDLTCTVDADCSLRARAFNIKQGRKATKRAQFYAQVLAELLEGAQCPP